MYNYYGAVLTYESENKINDIENNITETLLANNEIERTNQQQFYKKYVIIGLSIVFLLATTFGLLYLYHIL
jgi:hypothetical protein